jgi:hypothetical protein
MSLNMVVVDGIASHVALRYDEQAKPELRFTLVQQEKEWPLYLPCFSPGAAGERLASEIDDGSHIVVTSGKLAYKKRSTQKGEVSRLEILVWSVDRLSGSAPAEHEPSPEYNAEGEAPAFNLGHSGAPDGRDERAPASKARRPRWKPEPSHRN